MCSLIQIKWLNLLKAPDRGVRVYSMCASILLEM